MLINGFRNELDFYKVYGGRFMCFETGDFGYRDDKGENFHIAPANMTREKGEKMIEESIKMGENLFVKEWEIKTYLDDVDY